MSAAVGRTAVLGCIRTGQYSRIYSGTYSLRMYATAPGDSDKPSLTSVNTGNSSRESVESVLQRILEPDHAKSIGVASEGAQSNKAPKVSNTDQRALVPLNIIYLPPPKWHQPLRPLIERQPQNQAPLDQKTDSGNSWSTAPIENGNTIGDSRATLEEQYGKSFSTPSSDGIIARIARMFASRPRIEPVFKDALKYTPKNTTKPASEKILEAPKPDSSDGLQAEQKAQADLSRVTAEKWQDSTTYRILVTWRQTLDSLRSLPKDDDWVTWAGKALNEITGYDRIALLKMQVDSSGEQFHAARRQLNDTKSQHARATKSRIANQREINSLLQRKHLWSEEDVARFTSLYRDEHQAESAETQSAKDLKEAEALVDHKYDELVNAIRERYHEEQIWSDKIRRASTYGTWAVLFMNILALFLAQAIFEPRKRRKIVAGVDERLSEAMSEQKDMLASTGQAMEQRIGEQEKAVVQMAQHLYNMSAVMDAISMRQERGMSEAGAQVSEPVRRPEAAVVDPSVLLGGSDGYSDTELDMYYAQMHSRRALPESMIWKVASSPHQKQAYSRAEAGQLALETAALTSLIAGTLYWFSS
ncbi:sensitivity to high expression protein she9 [Coemansia sp. RSA 370]|nr:sensitivity to high expression protein she9 [Coemansia sp. RSA 560]KAJ2282408.1 sensitivity to high expression protein she9 [Coemansia sp. RSA 370]